MKNVFYNARILRHWGRLGSLALAESFLRSGLSISEVCKSVKGNCRLPRLGLELDATTFKRFATGIKYALSLGVQCGASFTAAKDHTLQVQLDGMHLRVETAEELFILHEIFVEGVYQFSNGEPTLYLDVGANVGFSSLFFASRPNVVAVQSYEPFPKTYRMALTNLEANPDLRERIEIHPFALWDSDAEFEWEYALEYRGSMGGFQAPQIKGRNEGVTKEKVQALDVARILTDIRKRQPKIDIVVKLDCEGAEYVILERLAKCGLLREATAFLIEWHVLSKDHDPHRLLKCLQNAGFGTLQTGLKQNRVGMIYAMRL